MVDVNACQLRLLPSQPACRLSPCAVEQNKPLIRADKLQQLHTLTNLAAVLDDLKDRWACVACMLGSSALILCSVLVIYTR